MYSDLLLSIRLEVLWEDRVQSVGTLNVDNGTEHGAIGILLHRIANRKGSADQADTLFWEQGMSIFLAGKLNEDVAFGWASRRGKLPDYIRVNCNVSNDEAVF